MTEPLITVVIPSYNQGAYLEQALQSVLLQPLPVEVFVMDGGSDDASVDIIKAHKDRITYWRSHQDDGQAAAINEGIGLGKAPYVCWLNSDDFYFPRGLDTLLEALMQNPSSQVVYGKCWTVSETGRKVFPYLTFPFSENLFANFCFIAQPATLIKRAAWEAVGGLDEHLTMAFDYELWWKLYTRYGNLLYCNKFVAATRAHKETKTANYTDLHYEESIEVVRRYHGQVPFKWQIGLPVMKMVRKFF